MVSKSSQIDDMALEVEGISTAVLGNITDIAASAQENSASIEEILGGINQQDNRLSSIVQSFKDLENLIVGYYYDNELFY